MRHTLKLKLMATTWCAIFSDPKIAETMGGSILPTQCLEGTPAKEVLEAIRALNPEYDVSLERG